MIYVQQKLADLRSIGKDFDPKFCTVSDDIPLNLCLGYIWNSNGIRLIIYFSYEKNITYVSQWDSTRNLLRFKKTAKFEITEKITPKNNRNSQKNPKIMFKISTSFVNRDSDSMILIELKLFLTYLRPCSFIIKKEVP